MRVVRLAVASMLIVACAACGASRASVAAVPDDSRCPDPAPLPQGDTISVAVTSQLDPQDVIAPANPGELWLLDLAYERFLRIDCRGRVAPSLAASWMRSGEWQWTFTLRSDARFWNGDPVLASDVLAAWRRNMAGVAASPAVQVIMTASASDARTLTLETRDTTLLSLTLSLFAVSRARGGASWPEGTGSYRVEGATRIELHSAAPSQNALLRVRTANPLEARDLIDARAEVVLTDDPAVVRYAAASNRYSDSRIEHDFAWALLLAGRAGGAAHPAPDTASVRSLQSALALDIARPHLTAVALAQVRAAACTGADAGVPAAPAQSAIAYRGADDNARAIAERLVALSAIAADRGSGTSALASVAPELVREGRRLTTRALSDADFAAALRGNTMLAFIVSRPLAALERCERDLLVPLLSSPWHAVARTAGELRIP